LCTDAQVLSDVRTWRRERGETAIPVILAGSRHIERQGDEPGENEAVVVFGTGEEAVHRKIAPYVFRDHYRDDGTPSATEIERTEFIGSTSNTLAIHYSGDWSLAVAICKDLLDTAVVRALEDLRVRLILVPACSEKTDLLEHHARQLSRNAQSTVIVANLPTGPEAACAIFATPMKSLDIFTSPMGVLANGPVVCVLEIKPTPQVRVIAI
jgi:predicted amidohydrolase